MGNKRLVYLGTPIAAVAPLQALVAEGFDVTLVVSQPDRKRGRGGAMVPSPVKAAAIELGLRVSDQVSDVVDVGADLGVVVAYGRLIKPAILDVVPMVNLHFSLLPRWRGAAPVERAILAGDHETGVCLMGLEEGLDTGPIYGCVKTKIEDAETADELRERLVELGTKLLVGKLSEGLGAAEAQTGESSYADKMDPSEMRIDWSRSAVEIHRLVRLGGAWSTFRSKRLRVVRVARTEATELLGPSLKPGELCNTKSAVLVGTGSDPLVLTDVQPEAKQPVRARDWANGAHLRPEERLGAET